MMTGYIEAIEARLHRMEGLLGGLVKDKDPRAEIVRAELDAMAREAEMTGLKLRRSKAYEEINHAMASTSSSAGASSSMTATSTPGSMSSAPPPRPQNQHVAQQQQGQQQQQQQQRPGTQQPALGYRPHVNTPLHPDTNSLSGHSSSRPQPALQPSPGSPAPRPGHYQPYDHPRHPPTPLQQSHPRAHPSMLSQPTSGPYQKQHHSAGQQASSPHYSTNYGDSGFSSSGSQSYPDSRPSTNNIRPGPYPPPSHHQSQPLHERDHYRSNSGHGTNGNSTSFNTSQRHSYSNGTGSYPMDTRRLVTHRPSLTANQLSNPMTGYMEIPGTTAKDVPMIMPSIDVIDDLLGVHFQYIHPVIPMLDSRTMHDQIHQNESPPSHLLFAVLGLASRFSDNSAFRTPQPGLERPPCTIFYERAKFLIKDEYDNAHVATLQALLLMAVQQMGFCESQRAWLYLGLAIRMAQDLGINKEPSAQEVSRNRLQCELRKRTWWSLYVVERLVCTGLGRPLTITHKDCEAGFPLTDDDESEPMSSTMSPYSMSNFIHLITLTRIQGDILDFIRAKYNSTSKPNNHSLYANSPLVGIDHERDHRMETSAATFSLLDKSLIEWRQNLPDDLQNPTAQSPHFGLFLHLTFNTLIILLHRPEVPNSQTSASLCTQAAVAISEIIEILMDAKALTSMFVTCLYAIFSAGIVHFMNIPSVQKLSTPTNSSPVLPDPKGRPLCTASSAKTNLKRCIDALKFLSNHWVSAARRAKVLEDLLDLKHVSLKDLEVDTFKNSPVAPSWVLESQYKDAIVGPREGQDKLRQQCRSKVMAIHSLLANDDEFKRMQERRTSSFSERDESGDDMESADEDYSQDEDTARTFDHEGDADRTGKRARLDMAMDISSTDSGNAMDALASARPVGLGLGSPISSAHTSSPPATHLENGVLSSSSEPGHPLDGAPNSDLHVDDEKADIKVENNVGATTPRPDSGLLTPMTVAHDGASPVSGSGDTKSEPRSVISSSASASSNLQGAMLDPFSMPSSISFSEWNHERRTNGNHGGADGAGSQAVSQLSTVWTTDAVTNRTTARSTTSSPMIASSATHQDLRRTDKETRKTVESTPPTMSTKDSQPLSLYHEAITHAFPGSKLINHEEQDLVWQDMPPTLGLDEWTAYIGAMMMRWLYASGQSPPGSTMSS